MCTSELGNFSGRTSNTTANVEDPVAILDTNLRCKVMFVAGNGLVERFTVRIAAEMERLTPAIFVQIRPKIVVTIYDERLFAEGMCEISYCLVKVAYSSFRACRGILSVSSMG